MRKFLFRILGLFTPWRRRKAAGLSSTQRWILRNNLRALLFSKEHVSEQNESAA
jgi:hypothetical protein